MLSPFDPCEFDFFGDLATDTQGLWEVFEFVRLHFPTANEAQVLEKGRGYIARWIDAGWIRIADSPLHPTTITSLPILSQFLQQHSSEVTRYLENSASLDITEEGLACLSHAHLTRR